MNKIFIGTCLLLFSFTCIATEVLTPENWKPQVVGEATINADRLDFDYELYIATFTGNVVIQHPEFTAVADKIIVVFEQDSNESSAVEPKKGSGVLGEQTDEAQQRVKSAVAIGNVKAVGENQLITCDRANYFKDNSMVRLIGEENNPPVVHKDGRTISGQIITLWLEDNRVETSGDIKLKIPASSTEQD